MDELQAAIAFYGAALIIQIGATLGTEHRPSRWALAAVMICAAFAAFLIYAGVSSLIGG